MGFLISITVGGSSQEVRGTRKEKSPRSRYKETGQGLKVRRAKCEKQDP